MADRQPRPDFHLGDQVKGEIPLDAITLNDQLSRDHKGFRPQPAVQRQLRHGDSYGSPRQAAAPAADTAAPEKMQVPAPGDARQAQDA